jgi:PTH1 family peptidyl-tRNA hydrolase
MKLIFAQGNPEPDYSDSRHNVGFLVLNTIAQKLEANWVNKPKFHALIVETNINDKRVLLIKPTAYYNEVGPVVRRLIDFYKLNTEEDLLILHDDLTLKFGTVRVRERGGDAGNNGLKSINAHINQPYARIRIGINNELSEKMDDATFVLAKFSIKESKQLETLIVPHIIELIQQFTHEALQITSYKNLK